VAAKQLPQQHQRSSDNSVAHRLAAVGVGDSNGGDGGGDRGFFGGEGNSNERTHRGVRVRCADMFSLLTLTQCERKDVWVFPSYIRDHTVCRGRGWLIVRIANKYNEL
jgi:hypothetical protein